MRIMVLLCTIWLTGCTYTKTTRATLFQRGDQERFHRDLPKALEDKPWVSVSVWIISYPSDQRFISTRALASDKHTPAFQQYPHLQFAREGYSFVSPEQASEMLALADKLDTVQFVEMPLLNVPVSDSGSSLVGTSTGFGVWLRTLAVSGSSATIKYSVGTSEVAGVSRNEREADWKMNGEAELGLGACYLRTITTDDPQLKVAVLLRLLSVSHPDQEENTES